MFLRKMKTVFAVGAAVGGAHAASAAITLDIGGGGYSNIGSGYGCTRSNTQLCVTFSSRIGDPAPFTLSMIGQSRVFTLGSVFLNDRIRDRIDNLSPLERDNLGVRAFLSFTSPTPLRASAAATRLTIPGRFLGDGVDLALLFSPILIDLPNQGRISVEFSPLIFTTDPQRLTQQARVRLLSGASFAPGSFNTGSSISLGRP